MITLPIIVLGALTGVSEGQTIRQGRKLASEQCSGITCETWTTGWCFWLRSTGVRRNINDRDTCISLCRLNYVGIDYDSSDKTCFCLSSMIEEGVRPRANRECYLFGSCARLEEDMCGAADNCSWNGEKNYCRRDTSVPEYDSEQMLAKPFRDELTRTVETMSHIRQCSTVFENGGGELAENEECRDDNLDRCLKKDVDANNECPGVWEKDPCEATEVTKIQRTTESKDDCKNECSNDDGTTYKAINYWEVSGKCECIIEGELFNITPDNDDDNDNSGWCFIYPGAEEDKVSTEICSEISLLSDCESDVELRNLLCAEKCARMRETFTESELEKEKDLHLCDQVEECKTERLWLVCAHRCGYLHLCKKNDTPPSLGTSEARDKLIEEQKRQEVILLDLVNAANSTERQKILDDEAVLFRGLIEAEREKLGNLPMEKANKQLAGTISYNATDNPFRKALMSNNVVQVRLATEAYVGTSGRLRNRRALQLLNAESTDSIERIVSRADNVMTLTSAAGFDVFGNLGATLSLVEPLTNVLNVDNTVRGRIRSLVELKLNIAAQATENMGPIGTLFGIARDIMNGVNSSETCQTAGEQRGDCSADLTRELPGIVASSVLGAIGNGQLSDLFNIFQMAERVVAGGTLTVLQVEDVMTLGAAAVRGGCAVASFVFPVAAIPCTFAVSLIEILRDSDIFGEDSPAQEWLDGILRGIENNPLVRLALPALGAVVNLGTQIISTVLRVPNMALNVLAAGAVGFLNLIGINVGGGRRRTAIVAPTNSRRPSNRRNNRPVRRTVVSDIFRGTVNAVADAARGIGNLLFGR